MVLHIGELAALMGLNLVLEIEPNDIRLRPMLPKIGIRGAEKPEFSSLMMLCFLKSVEKAKDRL